MHVFMYKLIKNNIHQFACELFGASSDNLKEASEFLKPKPHHWLGTLSFEKPCCNFMFSLIVPHATPDFCTDNVGFLHGSCSLAVSPANS